MHHIYSKTKRRNILALADDLLLYCPDSVCLVKGLHIGNFLFNQFVMPTRPVCPAILMLGLPGSYVILVS